MNLHPPQGEKLPRAASRLLERARSELQHRQFDAASSSLDHVLALAPACEEALSLAGVLAQMRGEHAKAAELLRRARELNPKSPRTQMALGISLFERGDAGGAVAALRRACELAPGLASAWYNLGKALKLDAQVEAAIGALQRALAIEPSHVSAQLTLADALASIGRIDEAVTRLRQLLQRHPQQAHAWFALANLKVVPLNPQDTTRLQQLFQRTDIPEDERILFGFALAKSLEDQGQYGAAFSVLEQANALQRARVRWDAAAHRERVQAIMQAFAAPMPQALDPQSGHEVVFITSVPRSGSSLVEQILASHPEVHGANEISDLPDVIHEESLRRGHAFPHWAADASAQDWARLGQDYLARTERWRRERPRFTDKNLVSWELVGAALAMLPGARVITCHRDPLELCVACFRQWFVKGAEFSYELNEMSDYLADYQKLSRFWQERFPQQVFGLSYESLLSEPETVIRRLLDFCGLPFTPACLDFHRTERFVRSAASAAQVRQPLDRKPVRSASYGACLDPLREQLQRLGL